LNAKIGAFVDHYNRRRYRESLNNLTPADAYCGRGTKILRERERIERITIENRRLRHQMTAA
jgi:putative transposase